jgi:polyisoprenoid-binding protein YceI
MGDRFVEVSMPRMPVPPPARARALVLALALLPAAPAAAEVRAWALDPVHTRVLFAVSHAGFSEALGTVSGSTGALLFDPDDPWQGARLEVTVPLARLDLGDADWNEATLGGRLLDVEDYPTAHFASEQVYPAGPRQATVCGPLTLRGVTRPLCMQVTINSVERHPMPPFRRTAGFSATATLSRSAFGIDAWDSMIGDTVELRIEAEAVRDDDAAKVFEAPASEPVDGSL